MSDQAEDPKIEKIINQAVRSAALAMGCVLKEDSARVILSDPMKRAAITVQGQRAFGVHEVIESFKEEFPEAFGRPRGGTPARDEPGSQPARLAPSARSAPVAGAVPNPEPIPVGMASLQRRARIYKTTKIPRM